MVGHHGSAARIEAHLHAWHTHKQFTQASGAAGLYVVSVNDGVGTGSILWMLGKP